MNAPAQGQTKAKSPRFDTREVSGNGGFFVCNDALGYCRQSAGAKHSPVSDSRSGAPQGL